MTSSSEEPYARLGTPADRLGGGSLEADSCTGHPPTPRPTDRLAVAGEGLSLSKPTAASAVEDRVEAVHHLNTMLNVRDSPVQGSAPVPTLHTFEGL